MFSQKMQQQLLSGKPCLVTLPKRYVGGMIDMVNSLDPHLKLDFLTKHDDGCQAIGGNDLSWCQCSELDMEITREMS